MRNVHRITISAISRPSQPHLTGGRRSWLVSITSNDTPVHSNLPLHDPFTAEQEDKCRWYLEHYAPLSPFQAEKAKEVSEELLEVYAQELWDQLRLQQIVNLWAEEEGHGEGERGSPLQTIEIDVVDGSELTSDYDPGETVHRLHWEVLEGPALWPAEIVSRVVLRRRVATGSIRIRDVSLWSKATTKSPSFNILLVIARDTNVDRTAFQDVDPSLTSQALFAIEDALDASQAQYRYRLNVEIVRPGTFEAFKEHLKASRKERGDGYFHLVHFDLHGRVAKLKNVPTAWLQFASSKTPFGMHWVTSHTVSKELKEYGIKIVVLNACESARANKGLEANLAQVFARNGGVSNVLAMSFKALPSAAFPFIKSFYDSFLLQNLAFSKAVSCARLYLRKYPSRDARYARTVDVKDWWMPVTYTDRDDIRVPDMSTSPILVPSPWTSREPVLVGREYDVLRFERLISKSRTVFLHGPAGVGKSAFIRHVVSAWQRTNFVDKPIVLDLDFPRLTVELLVYALSAALDNNQSVTSPDSPSRQACVQRLRRRRVALVIDSLDCPFSLAVEATLENADADRFGQERARVYSFLRDVVGKGMPGEPPYLILVGRGDEGWWTKRFGDLNGSCFQLAGLDLPAALHLAESILRDHGVPASAQWTRTDQDALVHIVNVLQRLPGTLQLVLPKATRINSSLEDFRDELLFGEVPLSIEDVPPAQRRTKQRLLLDMDGMFEYDLATKKFLLQMAWFWRVGPVEINAFLVESRDRGVIDLEQRVPAATCWVDYGAWTLDKYDMNWIHPLCTLFLREKLRRYCRDAPDGQAWALNIRKLFISAVDFRHQVQDLRFAALGGDLADFYESQRPSYFNLIVCLTMCNSTNSTIVDFKDWPQAIIEGYPQMCFDICSPPEQDLLAMHVENTLTSFLRRNGSNAVHPESLSFPLGLSTHLAFFYAMKGVLDNKFVTLALSVIEASQAQYGDISDTGIAKVFELKAVNLLRERKPNEAEVWWGKMLSAQSAEHSSLTTDGGVSRLDAIAIANVFRNADDDQSQIVERVLLRQDRPKPNPDIAWSEIKTLFTPVGELEQVDLNDAFLIKLEERQQRLIQWYKDRNVTGLNRTFRHDLTGYLKQFDTANNWLSELENVTGRGDWFEIAEFHYELFKNALKECRPGEALHHLDCYVQFLKQSTRLPPESIQKWEAFQKFHELIVEWEDRRRLHQKLLLSKTEVDTMIASVRTISDLDGDSAKKQVWSMLQTSIPDGW